MAIRYESDLYPPIKAYLEAQGFQVRGEIKSCDVMALRDDQVVVVELKRSFSLALVLQGIERQLVSEEVYLAVETLDRRASKRRQIRQLCRQLGLGLICVSFKTNPPFVQVLCEPEPYRPKPRAKKREMMVKEFRGRAHDYNVGGSSKKPIVTVYRQQALFIAFILSQKGTATIKELREMSQLAETGSILQRDYYNWFQRVARGTYSLSQKGEEALKQYQAVIDRFQIQQ